MGGTTTPASMRVLFMTHIWNAEIAARFLRLREAVGPGNAVVLFDGAKDTPERPEACGATVFRFDSRTFTDWKYPVLGPTMVPGHCHFPLLRYYSQFPQFTHYWFVEYDVAFTGNWRTFFENLSRYPHDLVTCHIRPYRREPNWIWWNSLAHPSDTLDRGGYLRSFNPICRLSGRALEYVHNMQLNGWRGHNEVLLPTLLSRGGFSLLDLGGNGPFVPRELKNRYYTSSTRPDGALYMLGTMRYRPASARPGRRRGRLYHPIKPPDPITTGIGDRTLTRVRHGWHYCRCLLSRALDRVPLVRDFRTPDAPGADSRRRDAGGR